MCHLNSLQTNRELENSLKMLVEKKENTMEDRLSAKEIYFDYLKVLI